MRRVLATIAIVIAGSTAGAPSRAATDEQGFVRVSPGEEEYKNPFGVGVMVATLQGDPSKPGIYVIRIKWPKNTMSRPHSHPEDRHVVVISGTWYTGTGDQFDPTKAVPLRSGGYMMHPAGKVHWDGTRDEEAVIQIMGYGPSGNTFVRPSEPPFHQQ
jgi:quercetin dioxygenase-like cupin family protein